MISLQELNPHNYPTTPEIDSNLSILYKRMNIIRSAWGNPMIVTSGLRSEADQMRINPSAPRSKHLVGAACDIADTDGSLHIWCKDNEQYLSNIGIWLENRRGGWQHFQILPFGSYVDGGSIWFNP